MEQEAAPPSHAPRWKAQKQHWRRRGNNNGPAEARTKLDGFRNRGYKPGQIIKGIFPVAKRKTIGILHEARKKLGKFAAKTKTKDGAKKPTSKIVQDLKRKHEEEDSAGAREEQRCKKKKKTDYQKGPLCGKTVRIVDEQAGKVYFGLQGVVQGYTEETKQTLVLLRGKHQVLHIKSIHAEDVTALPERKKAKDMRSITKNYQKVGFPQSLSFSDC